MTTLSSRPFESPTERELTRDDVVDALTRMKPFLVQMTPNEAAAACAGMLLTLDVADYSIDLIPTMLTTRLT